MLRSLSDVISFSETIFFPMLLIPMALLCSMLNFFPNFSNDCFFFVSSERLIPNELEAISAMLNCGFKTSIQNCSLSINTEHEQCSITVNIKQFCPCLFQEFCSLEFLCTFRFKSFMCHFHLFLTYSQRILACAKQCGSEPTSPAVSGDRCCHEPRR